MKTADYTDEVFGAWLIGRLGPCKWIIGRSNKKRRADGYTRFFTQRKIRALYRAFETETDAPMDSMSNHLTEPNRELAEKRAKTPPGMAFWSGTGPEKKTCRECSHWDCVGYLAGTGLLKDAECKKYVSMMNGEGGFKLHHYTPACKYFDPAIQDRPVENPKR